MKAVLAHFSLTFDKFNPHQVSGYGMSERKAHFLIENGHVSMICSLYDVIIIGDTTPHGRALLESLLLEEKTPSSRFCQAKIVIEITNRFDHEVRDVARYHATMEALAAQTQTRLRGRLFWVANNNFDKAYTEQKLQMGMPFMRILRPLGIAGNGGNLVYPWGLPSQDINVFAAQMHHTNILPTVIEKFSLPIAVFPLGHKYGGPANLLKFKAWLEFPYQYSTMKFYENIAYGVPQLFPSPRFMEKLFDVKTSS
ncbi:hypothetical protein HK100_010323 [Physocladia obscura]|uniref:Uncharacterized protein n=1 Tax=Physocladia obscura TaxID=109957 RepID=A0AAD5XHL7_9FUNG|nr:hypothetical protein HK100_010323 [Physocladia obscura]